MREKEMDQNYFFFLRNIDSEKRGRVVLIVFPVHGKGFVRVAVA